jgi:exodeoxyribonuclease V alpha subunit
LTATIDSLRGAKVLRPIDVHFARAVGRMSGEQRSEVLLAAALTSRRVGDGHVCLDLARLSQLPLLLDEDGRAVPRPDWPAIDAWIDVLHQSPLVGGASDGRPFVLDDRSRLYLRRYWEHQETLARAIRTRLGEVEDVVEGSWLRTALDRLFPRHLLRADETDWQRIAALVAARRRFTVISGGPGTGKTYTVVKILALLIEAAERTGNDPPRMTLLAPTGKAAARLAESVTRAKIELDCAASVKDRIPEEAATIHRALGSIGGSATNFRHNADRRLVTDLVLVDEASMVDLGLMRRLTDAMPDHARLVLLGDKDQLASVDAGAVLGDICNTGRPLRYSREQTRRLEELSGESLPIDPTAPSTTGIWDCIVHLKRSYRYGPESGIGALAAAINAGHGDDAIHVLESDEFADVTRVEPDAQGQPGAWLHGVAVDGFGPYLRSVEPAAQLRALERFRVLCAHRRGASGVEPANREIEAALRDAGLVQPQGLAYVGRPLIVTTNDYVLGLFNGDVGVVGRDPEHADGRLVFFDGKQGALRRLSPSRLPPHETVYAMSVHKSQGSEFDDVVVLLPDQMSPVLSRELLYTAVTRARCGVTVCARRDIVRQATAQPIERASGLRDRLWNGTAD